MMMQNWNPSIISIKVVDNNVKQTHFIEPLAFADSLRWSQYPNMAYQYSQCIGENLKNDFHENPQSVLSSKNFSIYFDIWYSLNGRFHQRIYDPRVDFTKTQWHPFETPTFTLPLLNEYSHLRKEIKEITSKVHEWSNCSNSMFFADFPQLTLENYIMPEMYNVTLHVLLGAVKLHQENGTSSTSLSKGQSIRLNAGSFHKVSTISDIPSCFYYTYSNSTKSLQENSTNENSQKFSSSFIVISEIKARWENYKKFFYHVANSLLFEFYNVPMPRRIRDIHDM
jgi:vitamin K-dependent gamma-carboxylase